MIDVVVIEPYSDEFTCKISLHLKQRGAEVHVTRLTSILHKCAADIAIVPPNCTVPSTVGAMLRCKVLLLPGGVFPDFAYADSVVTYGMGAHDTLTLSSIGGESCVLSLRRELVTADGRILDRQELNVHGGGTIDERLTCFGTALLLGYVVNKHLTK